MKLLNTVEIGLGLAQEIIDLLRSYLNTADDDIQRSLIQKAIDDLKATEPDDLT
jgi:hypothetical protein